MRQQTCNWCKEEIQETPDTPASYPCPHCGKMVLASLKRDRNVTPRCPKCQRLMVGGLCQLCDVPKP